MLGTYFQVFRQKKHGLPGARFDVSRAEPTSMTAELNNSGTRTASGTHRGSVLPATSCSLIPTPSTWSDRNLTCACHVLWYIFLLRTIQGDGKCTGDESNDPRKFMRCWHHSSSNLVVLDGPQVERRVGVAIRPLRYLLNRHHPNISQKSRTATCNMCR